MRLPTLSRRNRARVVVYLVLGIALIALVVALRIVQRPPHGTLGSNWRRHDWTAEPTVKQLRDYVHIDTSERTGDELAGARWLAARLEEAGIEPHIESLGNHHANLWAILEGESREALVLHSHIDVADIEQPAKWKFPPFEAHYDAPWVYGRGVFDMKSVTIAQLNALVDIKRSGRKPKRSIILLATGGEESGSELGAQWILREHPELVRRFWAVLTEGGIVEATSPQDMKFWGIEVAQKQFAEGAACAASKPRLEDLRTDLLEREHPLAPLRVPEETRVCLAAYGRSRTRPRLKNLMLHPERALTDVSAFLSLPDYVQSMYRDEVVPFDVQQAPGGGFRLPFKVHLLPGSDLQDVLRRLLPRWLTVGTEIYVGPPIGADHGSPPDNVVVQTLVDVIHSEYPDVVAGPYLVPWSATDSRFFRAHGIPSYGFSPFTILSTDTYQVDRTNEHMAMPGFVHGVELYRKAVRALTE